MPRSLRTRSAICWTTLALGVALPAAACAQVRASQHAISAQTVAQTTITVEYYRPVARGRDSLFGGVVHWGRTWATGANWATTLDVDHDVRVDGHSLPKGKYSLWMIPEPAPQPWTLVVSRDAHRFHMQPPDAKDDQLRFPVQPGAAPRTDVLTWSFPAVAPMGATLERHWGTTAVPLEIAVTPDDIHALATAEPARYTGRWRVAADSAGGTGDGSGATAAAEVTITSAGDTLRAHASSAIAGLPADFDLFPDGDDRFHPGLAQQGQVTDARPDVTFAFTVQGGRATALRLLGVDDHPLAHGEPAP